MTRLFTFIVISFFSFLFSGCVTQNLTVGEKLLREENNPEIALEYLQKVVNEEPGNAKGQRLSGRAYWKIGNYKLAKKHLEQAVTLQPDSADAWNNLGWTYNKLNLFPGCQTPFKKHYNPGKAATHGVLLG